MTTRSIARVAVLVVPLLALSLTACAPTADDLPNPTDLNTNADDPNVNTNGDINLNANGDDDSNANGDVNLNANGDDSNANLNANANNANEGGVAGEDVDFTGTITEIGDGYLVAAGTRVVVAGTTEVEGALAVGALVRVKGIRDATGVVVAEEVEVEDDDRDGDDGNDNGDDDNGNENENDNGGDDNGNDNDNANDNDNDNDNDNGNDNGGDDDG